MHAQQYTHLSVWHDQLTSSCFIVTKTRKTEFHGLFFSNVPVNTCFVNACTRPSFSGRGCIRDEVTLRCHCTLVSNSPHIASPRTVYLCIPHVGRCKLHRRDSKLPPARLNRNNELNTSTKAELVCKSRENRARKSSTHTLMKYNFKGQLPSVQPEGFAKK